MVIFHSYVSLPTGTWPKNLDFVASFFCNEQRITGPDVSRSKEGSFEARRRRAPHQGMPQRDAYGGFWKWDPQTMGCNTKILWLGWFDDLGVPRILGNLHIKSYLIAALHKFQIRNTGMVTAYVGGRGWMSMICLHSQTNCPSTCHSPSLTPFSSVDV